MTKQQAIELAQSIKRGPGVQAHPWDRPLSTVEALMVIQQALKAMPFNWITGQKARDILKKALDSEGGV